MIVLVAIVLYLCGCGWEWWAVERANTLDAESVAALVAACCYVLSALVIVAGLIRSLEVLT